MLLKFTVSARSDQSFLERDSVERNLPSICTGLEIGGKLLKSLGNELNIPPIVASK